MKLTTLLALTLTIPLAMLPCRFFTLPDQNGKSKTKGKPQQKTAWKAATFRGLKIGQSSLNEVLQVLGKPESAGPEADRDNSDPDPPLYYSYKTGGEFTGELAVIIGERSKKVLEVRNLPKSLSKEEAIRHFGPNYIEARYEFCPDIDSTAGPIYPDPDGQILQVEYRERGIELAINENAWVTEILYSSSPPGLRSKNECKRFSRKSGMKKR